MARGKCTSNHLHHLIGANAISHDTNEHLGKWCHKGWKSICEDLEMKEVASYIQEVEPQCRNTKKGSFVPR